jgi:ATP-dependent 26S proteasome regulatory subunit
MLAAECPTEQSIPLIFREGRLQNAALYLNGSDLFFNNDSSDLYNVYYRSLLAELSDYPNLVFLSSEKMLEFQHYPHNKPVFTIEFTLPAHPARKQLWLRQKQNGIGLSPEIDFDDLANKFRLTAGQITDAIAMARSRSLWRGSENGLINNNDLYLVCREQSRQRLNTLTNQTNSCYNWDDIILPGDQKEQLKEIFNQVKYRRTVFNDWGFGRKLARGKGLNILFSGPSGTGKTMAAEIMGNELGIDLYKIDLSVIVSKYIGETEKNLDRIFREGKTANAIIFFDEADSLFGKRSEVRDSHDRYANIEISYLLQKMEDYDGVIILATNLRKNMDEAFDRRMHFAVEFPMPEEPDRYRIWQSMFPEEAPLGHDLDIAFLARQFQITGGNIRNITLASAFLAAQDGGFITMGNIIRATKREYQKMGKLCTETDFAHYFSMVKG